MATVEQLAGAVAEARKTFIARAKLFSEHSAKWKASPENWCAIEIVEHLFWAEQGGVLGMWKSLDAYRQGGAALQGETPHNGLTIEEIVRRTWKEKEIVPPIAAPRMGGPIEFWIISLAALQYNLYALAKELTDDNLKIATPPHPISGPLNMHQRFEFLRFHLNRHEKQLQQIQSQLLLQN